jgi:hypothetical protein
MLWHLSQHLQTTETLETFCANTAGTILIIYKIFASNFMNVYMDALNKLFNFITILQVLLTEHSYQHQIHPVC